MVHWIVLAAMTLSPIPPTELNAYVLRPEPKASVRQEVRDGETWIKFTSQTWEGRPWTHTIVITPAPGGVKSDLAVLEITGGAPNQRDLEMARRAADATGVTIATLYDIPNQPIDGRQEDDLIAHTFEGFLRDGRPEQILLFAMAKSAVRAMDVLGEVGGYRRFIPTGASKRGWTTWLTAATGDRRVVAIAPRVIDMLNTSVQLDHQLASWGKFSPMIADYTRRNLPNQTANERGKNLTRLVDPFSYRSRIKVPTLIVNGTNDAYWTVDAHGLYVSELKAPTWILEVPNVGHGMGDRAWDETGITGFIRAIAQRTPMPRPRFMPITTGTQRGFRVDPKGTVARYRLWGAVQPDRHFDTARWQVAQEGSSKSGPFVVAVNRPKGAVVAWFLELEYGLSSGKFVTTSRVVVDGPMAAAPPSPR